MSKNEKKIAGESEPVKAAFQVKELLVDGSFEQSVVGANTWTHSKTVGGWKSDSEIETWGKGFYGLKAADGDKIAELDFDKKASNIFQDVKTEAGAEYTFAFDYMKRPDSAKGSDTINVFWNGKLVGTVDPTKSEWSKAEFKVTGTGESDRIEFREASDDNDSYGGLLDNASLKQSGPSTAQKEAAEKAHETTDSDSKGKDANNDDDKHDGREHGDGDHNDDGHTDNGKDVTAKKAAAKEAAAKEAAAKEAAAKEAAAKEAAAKEAAAKEAAAKEAAAKEAAAKEAAAKEAAAKEAAAKEAAAKEAAAKEAAAKEAAAKEAAAKEAAAKEAAAKEAAAKEAADKAAADAAAKEAADKAAADAAAKEAADKAAYDAAHKEGIVLTAADASDVVTGVTLHGKGQDDIISGGKGNDTVVGHNGDDILFGDETGAVTFGLNIDASLTNAADPNAVSITLGNLPDGAVLSAGVQNQDGTWTLTHDQLAGLKITAFDAKDFDLSVRATATDGSGLSASSVIHVTLQTGTDDLLVGGNGSDVIFGNAGDDVIYGGSIPTGVAHVNTAADDDVILGGDGNDRIWGNSGQDAIDGGADNDWISGGKGNDVITGGAGDNTLYGNSGDDVFVAQGGNDKIVGGSGFDTIDFSGATGGVNVNLHAHTTSGFGTGSVSGVEAVIGSAFDDVFTADGKMNVFVGGEGNDTFVWGYGDAKRGADVVTDFEIGDRIDLHAVTKGDASKLQIKDDGVDTHVMAFVGKTWVEVATLKGFSGHGQDEMIKDGSILV